MAAPEQLVTLWREGERLAKTRALAVSLETMRFTHRIAMRFFFAFLGAVFFAASLFAELVYGMIFYASWRVVPVDLFTVTTGLFGLASLGFLLWNLREKRWLDAFDLEGKVAGLRR